MVPLKAICTATATGLVLQIAVLGEGGRDGVPGQEQAQHKRRSSSGKTPDHGLQVGPLLGHGGEHLLEVATGEPGLNGPRDARHHPPQRVEGGMEVPPAQEPPLLPRPPLEGDVRHKPLLGAIATGLRQGQLGTIVC